MFKKSKTVYSQDDMDRVEQRLAQQKERNDEQDRKHKEEVDEIRQLYAQKEIALNNTIAEIAAQPHVLSNGIMEALSLHTFRRGGSVFIHGQDMEIWECVDGCDSNPSAKCRVVLPVGLVI